jgi:hypothetical protein
MANLVTSYAIDGERIVTAPVTLEEHSLIGAAAVAMPGATLGKGSTLGALAATLPGAQLPGGRPRLFSSHQIADHHLQLSLSFTECLLGLLSWLCR